MNKKACSNHLKFTATTYNVDTYCERQVVTIFKNGIHFWYLFNHFKIRLTIFTMPKIIQVTSFEFNKLRLSIYDNYIWFLTFICLIRSLNVFRQVKIAELYVRTPRKCRKMLSTIRWK